MPTPEGLCTKLEEVLAVMDAHAHLARLSPEAAWEQREAWGWELKGETNA